MTATWFLLRRYLFPDRANLMGLALWVSVAGVALGITQLMLVLSVMTGFQKLLQDNYTRITSEIVVVPRQSRPERPPFKPAMLGIPGIQASTPFALGQGMLVVNGGVAGVILEGIDIPSSEKVTPWNSIWVGKPDFESQKKNPNWIWLGKQLANKLRVKQGDSVNVLIADGQDKRVLPFVVTGITKFGIYDHDLRWARIDINVLNEIFRHRGVEPMYKVKVVEGRTIEEVAEQIRESSGESATTRLWSEINQNVFLAVQHQKKLLFLVLEIVIGLAARNVVNLLMMSSHQRRRDIAILRAMGMRLSGVVLFFVAQGAAVGTSGIIFGLGLGVLVCHLVERFQPAILSEAVYNVTKLPIRVELHDVVMVSGVAFLLCVVFSILPALRAALSRPVNAIRYE